jgi:hypothetical protein
LTAWLAIVVVTATTPTVVIVVITIVIQGLLSSKPRAVRNPKAEFTMPHVAPSRFAYREP